MNFSEGIQKISFPIIEPHLYIKPILSDAPILQINKIYSSDNFFNSNTFKDYKERFQKSEDGKKNNFEKGSIFDIMV